MANAQAPSREGADVGADTKLHVSRNVDVGECAVRCIIERNFRRSFCRRAVSEHKMKSRSTPFHPEVSCSQLRLQPTMPDIQMFILPDPFVQSLEHQRLHGSRCRSRRNQDCTVLI